MDENNFGPEDVCIGIPIDRGYPAAPPRRATETTPRTAAPPPRTAEPPRRAAATSASAAAKSYIERTKPQCFCFMVVILVITAICGFGFAAKNKYGPSFNMESVSVSLERNNNVTSDGPLVIAKWNIGISVRNSNSQYSFHFREFHVWVRCTSQGSSVAILPPFKQGHKNTTFLNATVYSLLSPDHFSPLIQCLEFDVNLRENGSGVMEVACKDMKLGLSSNATQGVMISGPRSCPISY